MQRLVTREMLWFMLIATMFLVGMVLMGNAVSTSAENDHRRQMECIQAGGNMELVMGSGTTCVKK